MACAVGQKLVKDEQIKRFAPRKPERIASATGDGGVIPGAPEQDRSDEAIIIVIVNVENAQFV